ncbi:MAG: GSCFA domain-containing protein [Alphaproteobacteria bacterium]|nr:GSCFA domain-containing protein [Alphaproteobacteria bacterium]
MVSSALNSNNEGVNEIFEKAVRDLAAGRTEVALPGFSTCIEADFRLRDCLVFMVACAYLAGDRGGASELADWARKSGKASDEFYSLLGRVINALGPNTGDDVWRFLQKNRCLPWNSVGSTVGSAAQKSVEPWFFAQQKINRFPKNQSDFGDLARLVMDYVLPGHLPNRPLFTRTSTVLTMGSCFAQELRNYMASQGMRSDWLFVPPGLNNTFAARQFLEWCATGKQSADAYWYDEATGGGARKWQPETEHKNYRAVLQGIDGLVLTVGLAEVWYDIRSGGVFWRGVPRSIYDPSIHKCRMSKVSENVENLVRSIEVARELRPGLPIILTLSPIPLRATFDDRSCISADAVSKSTLRVAIEEVMGLGLPGVSYWPSFEIVRWLGSHTDRALFGDDGNTRHVNRFAVQLILDQFLAHYFESDSPDRMWHDVASKC